MKLLIIFCINLLLIHFSALIYVNVTEWETFVKLSTNQNNANKKIHSCEVLIYVILCIFLLV
jgi:hypothetical protein